VSCLESLNLSRTNDQSTDQPPLRQLPDGSSLLVKPIFDGVILVYTIKQANEYFVALGIDDDIIFPPFPNYDVKARIIRFIYEIMRLFNAREKRKVVAFLYKALLFSDF
jgi:hypothetical protein